MNKPKIRKSLFIGLGGTGAKTLLALKKRFYEVYGHVDGQDGIPRFAQFLVFDTDAAATRNESLNGAQNTSTGAERDIRFEPSEVIGVEAPEVKEFIQDKDNKGLYDYWMPLENEYLLQALNRLDEGAGQIRLFGRLAYHWNAQKIAKTISKSINDILLAGNPDEDFEPLEAGGAKPLDVYIVSSLAGGTGSGMFMDVALKVRQILKEEMTNTASVQIQGFFVLPDIFTLELPKGKAMRVVPNAAGALLDLDFFQGFVPASYAKDIGSASGRLWDPNNKNGLQDPAFLNGSMDAIAVQYLGGEQTRIVDTPFDRVFLINNQNANGGTYKNVQDLSASIAKGIFASTTELSSGLRSQDDNDKGKFTFDNKTGWVGSIGVAEMIFSQPELEKHLSLRALEFGLAELLKEPLSQTAQAQGFMDELRLNEAGETKEIVDSFLSGVTSPSCFLPEDLFKSVSNERTRIQNEIPDLVKQINGRKSAKEAEVLERLSTIPERLVGDGLATSIPQFYTDFEVLLAKTQDELAQDEKRVKEELASEIQAVSELEEAILEIATSNMVVRLMKKGELEGNAGEWSESMDFWVQKSMESAAIEAALAMVSALGDECRKLRDAGNAHVTKFKGLKEATTSKLQNRRAAGDSSYSPNAFTINLHAKEMEEAEFLQNLNLNLKELLDELQEGGFTLASALDCESIKLVATMPSDEQGDSKVTQWLLANDPTDAQNIDSTLAGRTLKDLMGRSEPLLGLSKAGISVDNENIPLQSVLEESTSFLVCVPDATAQNKLERIFERLLPDNHVSVKIVPDQQDRIAVFKRQLGAPPAAITGAKRYLREYAKKHDEKGGDVFHVNYHWFEAMDSVNHNLQQGGSSTMEHGMRAWLYALLMGDVAHDDAKDMWVVKESSFANGQKNFTNETRSEVFEEVIGNQKLGNTFTEKWMGKLDSEGMSYGATRLKMFLSAPQKQANEVMTASETMINENALSRMNYILHPQINPYYKTISSDNPSGSTYLRYESCLELLNAESQMLLEVCKEFGIDVT